MVQRHVRIAILSFAFAFVAHDGRAQGVPLVSGDLSFGSGPTSSHARELWFTKASGELWSADLAVRIGGAGTTRPVVLLGSDAGVTPQYVNLVCLTAPNGSCRADFPSPSGAFIGVGVRQAVGEWILLGVGAGVTRYDGRFAEADVSVRIVPHLALVGEFRYIDFAIEGQRAWFKPLTFGARLYW